MNKPCVSAPGFVATTRVGQLLRRYAQFCLVGGSGVLVDMGVPHLLASGAGLGWNLSLSKTLAAEIALINNSWLSQRFGWRGTGRCA